VVTLTLVLALVLAACVPDAQEQHSIDLLNGSRAYVGIGPLSVDSSLQAKAHGHALEMAQGHRLFHSSLPAGVRGGWKALGENVGMGPSLEAVNNQFNHSADHMARRVSTTWNAVGIGVARDAAGNYWVVEEFGRF